MISHYGWVRLARKTWQIVTVGGSNLEAYRELLRWIEKQPTPPAASAVLPVGVHPDSQGGSKCR
jgi:hypothetical protein